MSLQCTSFRACYGALSIFLTAVFLHAPPAYSEVRAPFELSCENAFADMNSISSELGHPTVGFRRHIFNTQENLAAIDPFQMKTLKSGIKLDGKEVICIQTSLCFVVMSEKASKGRVQLTLRDVDGNKFILYADKLKGNYQARLGAREILPGAPAVDASRTAALRKIFVEAGLGKMPEDKMADFLTETQLATSTNSKESTNKIFDEGIANANSLVVEILKSGRALREEDLEKINWNANKGRWPFEDRDNAYMAGVLRGSSDRAFELERKLHVVKLDQSFVGQGADDGVTLVNIFLPPHEVSQAIARWLHLANRIDHDSSLEEVFSLYKAFVHIHPFMDGNGRTGRILMNYLLLKAGFPPLHKPSQSLYYSPEELAQLYAQEILK